MSRDGSDPVEVMGLVLPPRLVALLRAGRWVRPPDDVLERAVGQRPGLVHFTDLLALVGLRHEPWGAILPEPELYRHWGFAPGSLDPGLLDPALALPIARVDVDCPIVLDYRWSGADPRVVLLGLGPDPRWHEIAASFDVLAESLGLEADPA